MIAQRRNQRRRVSRSERRAQNPERGSEGREDEDTELQA
jgi:hypothetical protein